MKVCELLDAESKWTQKSEARDINQSPALFDHPAAVCWCFVGAIFCCYERDTADEVMCRVYRYLGLTDRPTVYGIVKWNDAPGRTFEEVRTVARELDI